MKLQLELALVVESEFVGRFRGRGGPRKGDRLGCADDFHLNF